MTPVSAQAEAIHDLYADVMTILVGVGATLCFIFFVLFQRHDTKTFSFVSSDKVKTAIMAERPYIAYTHNTVLEMVWTLVPCALLVFISIPSFTLALALDEEVNPWM